MYWDDLNVNRNQIRRELFKMFQVDMESLIQTKFEWMYQKQIQPTELNALNYWEFEQLIKLLNKKIKDENERHDEQDKKQQGMNFNPSSFNPNSMLKKYTSGSNFATPRL